MFRKTKQNFHRLEAVQFSSIISRPFFESVYKFIVLFYTGNPEIQTSVSEVKEQWRAIRHEARSERQRLEKLLKLWREYQGGMDDLVDWLVTVLRLMRNEDISGCSLDMVESQLQNLKVRYIGLFVR